MTNLNVTSFEITHFYPDFDRQKFWDFLVDDEWYSRSSIMPGEVAIEKPGEGQPQGLGAVRKLEIGDINITESVVRFDAPRYFSYAVHDGGMPVNAYRGDFSLEPKDGGLLFRYQGSYKAKIVGTGWVFKPVFRSRMRRMIPVWAAGYEAYHGIEE